MGWNDSGNGKNPWNNGPNQGVPDLDEVVRNLQKRFARIFGGGKSGDSGGAAGGAAGGFGIGLILIVGLAVWAVFGGLYTVDQAERGVELRFGKYKRTTQPGLHWHIPAPIETVDLVDVGNTFEYKYDNQMLTADENIVSVEFTVQYRRSDPSAWLFNVRDPESTLQQVSESAIREVVGKSTAEWVMGQGRAELVASTKELMQLTLDQYGAGYEIITINLTNATPPAQVQAAVDDATKAREDKERVILAAEAYSNDLLPRARGAAARQQQGAEAYKARVIANATGDASRFLSLLVEYEAAPNVTRERLYLETLEEVYGSSNKVILDSDGSGNLLYLPIDRLLEQSGRSFRNNSRDPDAESATSPQDSQTSRDERSRRSR
jgi:membrane protease subunit HflK